MSQTNKITGMAEAVAVLGYPESELIYRGSSIYRMALMDAKYDPDFDRVLSREQSAIDTDRIESAWSIISANLCIDSED